MSSVTSGPVLYNDLNKKANDLLTKDIPTTLKIELKAPKVSGWGLDASTTEKESSIIGSFTPKWQVDNNQYGTTVISGSLDTKRAIKVEATNHDLVKGLKAIFTATDSQTVSTQFEYKQSTFSINGTLNLLSPKGTTGLLASVIGYNGHGLGLQSEFNLSTKTITDLNANVTLNPQPDISIGFYGRFKKNILGSRLYYRYDKELAIAADAEANYVNLSDSPKFTIGAEYSVDPKNTLKGKVDTTGNVSAAFITKLSDRVKLALATSISTNNFSSSGKTSHGISVTIE